MNMNVLPVGRPVLVSLVVVRRLLQVCGVCGVECRVCGVWCMMCGVWGMVHGVWCMVYGLWWMVDGG